MQNSDFVLGFVSQLGAPHLAFQVIKDGKLYPLEYKVRGWTFACYPKEPGQRISIFAQSNRFYLFANTGTVHRLKTAAVGANQHFDVDMGSFSKLDKCWQGITLRFYVPQ